MAATGASFKLGIAFAGGARAGDRYIHSFGEVGRSTWMGDFQHFWLEAREQGGVADIGAYCLEHEAADAGRFLGGPDTPLNYAYHFDAGRYAAYLRERSEAQGLTRIEGRIARVERDGDSGDIAALVLDDGQHIAGDMFLDCTGFHALLIEQTLGVGFEDWGHWLPTDRALAVQTRATGPAVPYTRAIAHDAGWRWQIPLQHRVGNGLVYSSRHLGDDAAHDRLMASVEGQALIEPRLIRFRTGRRLAMWERNCVALSLSSGFVEPLESTSLHLVMIALTRLVQLLPFGHLGAAARNRFNDQARREIEAVRDFVLLHYHLNERPEPFWRERKEIPPPDSLAERIALFAEGAHTYQSADDLFRTGSWTQVMLGQRLTPAAWHPLARAMPPGELGTVLRGLQFNIAAAVARLPTHQKFLDSYCRSRE